MWTIEVWCAHDRKPGEGISCVEFVLYPIAGIEDGDRLLYQRNGADRSTDFVYGLDEAEWAVTGSLRFDGCINYFWNQDERCYWHDCGFAGLASYTTAFALLYKIAAEMMPDHRDDLKVTARFR